MRLRRVFKSAPTTFHYFQTSYFTITLYYPFYPLPIPPSPPLCPTPRPAPPQFQIRAIGATTIIHYSFFIIHHSLSSPPTPPFPPSPPLFTIPRPALSKIEIRAVGATTILHSSLFIIHYSSFILHFPPSPAAPRCPSRSPPRRPASFFRPIHTRTCS